MTQSRNAAPCSQKVQPVTKAQLPLSCPPSEEGAWSAHPRVFIPLDQTNEAACPYCGTRYQLVDE